MIAVFGGLVISTVLNDYFLTMYLWTFYALNPNHDNSNFLKYYDGYNINVHFVLGFALLISFSSVFYLFGTIYRLSQIVVKHNIEN
jgi:membrane-bound metal-dependent hydrolase YbcI (DUF457 family)